jgi:hypothetical protein
MQSSPVQDWGVNIIYVTKYKANEENVTAIPIVRNDINPYTSKLASSCNKSFFTYQNYSYRHEVEYFSNSK